MKLEPHEPITFQNPHIRAHKSPSGNISDPNYNKGFAEKIEIRVGIEV